MTAAIFGLVGATIGAVTALIGSALTERRQVRIESARFHRDQRSTAYDSLFRSATRAASYRYKIPAAGNPDQSILQQWFDDLVEVQYRLRVLISHCHKPGGGTILPVAVERLNSALGLLSEGQLAKSADLTDEVVDLVNTSARIAMGNEDPPPSPPPVHATQQREDIGRGS
jgi:hypothetical protein